MIGGGNIESRSDPRCDVLVLTVGGRGFPLGMGDVVLDVGLGHGPRDEQEEEAVAHKPTTERGTQSRGKFSWWS